MNYQQPPRIGRRAEKLDALNGKFVNSLVQGLEYVDLGEEARHLAGSVAYESHLDRPYSLDESIPNLDQETKDELQVAHAQVLDYLQEHMTVSQVVTTHGFLFLIMMLSSRTCLIVSSPNEM